MNTVNDCLGLSLKIDREGICYLVARDGRIVAGLNTRLLIERKALMVIMGKEENGYNVIVRDDSMLKSITNDRMQTMSIMVSVIRGMIVENMLKNEDSEQPGFYINGRNWVKCMIGLGKDEDGDDVFTIKDGNEKDKVYPYELGYVFITKKISESMAEMIGVSWEELMLFLQDNVVEGMEKAQRKEIQNGEDQ